MASLTAHLMSITGPFANIRLQPGMRRIITCIEGMIGPKKKKEKRMKKEDEEEDEG